MFKMYHMGLGTLAGALLCLTAPASAVDLSYNFDNPTGNLGNTHIYTNNGVAITAYGFNISPSHTLDLYGKADGGDENGLGLNIDPDHEIGVTNFVQLNMSNVWATHPTSLTMSIGSVQAGEGWSLYSSNVLGSLGTLLFSGTTDSPNTFPISPIPNGNQYLSVTASSHNVLITTLSTKGQVGVPEPTTMVILGSSLAMAAMRKRQRKTQEC